MKSRASRGVSEVENDKGPCTSSKFHFSKGKYGNIVLAWHGVLIRKAKANFQDICAEARKIYGVTDDGNQPAQVDPEIRTRVGLDSESEGATGSDNDSAGNAGHENHQTGDGDHHSVVGDHDEIDASDGNTNNNQNEGNDRNEGNGHHASDVVHNPEYQLEEVSNHAGPSRLGGRRSSIRASGSQSTVRK